MNLRFTWRYPVQLSLLALVLFLSSCASRRSIPIEEGWELLGERKVNFVRDMDEIAVSSRSQFTALRFRVEDRDVRLNELEVVFDNGDKLEPSLDDVIPADQFSRVIELAAEGRRIDRIRFKYRTTGNILEGRANVLIFGKRFTPYGY
ncbi:MAG TPA: hypothetical protein VHK69_10765 [Chitinophagaceae bacterium]|jgi:hypothetical protein|nr:hypothetical protein [Chitinophagaceae bacterium]